MSRQDEAVAAMAVRRDATRSAASATTDGALFTRAAKTRVRVKDELPRGARVCQRMASARCL